MLNQFLQKAKGTMAYPSMGDDACKEAWLRVAELGWRLRRMERDQPVPAVVSWEGLQPLPPVPGASRPKHTSEELQQLLTQKPTESSKQYLQRLQELLQTYDDYNAMLSTEGEDCWSDESYDSFEGRVEKRVEDMLDEPKTAQEEKYQLQMETHLQTMKENAESEILEESEAEEPDSEELVQDI